MRRYQKRKVGNISADKRFLLICAVLAALIFISVLINLRLKPISFELARSYGSDAVLTVVNQSVSEFFEDNDIGYSDLVRLRYDAGGFVTSMEYDSAAINRLKISFTSELGKSLSKLKTSKVRVPLGSLFGDLSLSGKGPSIGYDLSTKAVPRIDILSTVDTVGVNQSRHEIILRVTADVTVYLPPKTAEFSVTQDYVLAQTVIVGDVPAGYVLIE